jgi:hypothetical protein
MTIYTTMWSYLWDLVDDGMDESVRRLGGELSLDAVSVATAYHTFEQMRPQRRGNKLLREEQAAIYFQPDLSLYRDTVIRPHVAPMAQTSNPLEQLAGAASRQGLDVISWTVCLHNSFLCAQYPQLVQRTAYGDSLGWILCPGCDDVRAYVVALCTDLARNYGVHRVELETCNFGGYGHTHQHVKDGVVLGNIGQYLFSLSFSEGCCSKATARGIDVDALRAWVQEQLDPVFRDGVPLAGSIEDLLRSQADLAAFQDLREELVTSLIQEVRQALKATSAELSFLLMGDRWIAGIRPDLIAPHTDRLGILAYTASPAEVVSKVQAALESGVPGPNHLVTGLCAYPPASPDADTLQAVARAAIGTGVEELSFYNYGICPNSCLKWVRSCIDSI